MISALLCWMILQSCLQGTNAQDTPCTVTQDAAGTHYSVPEFNATDCHFSWLNSTKHVVANHEGKMGRNSRTTLTTRQCFGQMHYKRDCISEEFSHEAICTTNCSGKAQPLQHERGTRSHIWPVVVVVAVLLVGAVLLAFSCRKRHFFNTVKQKVPDVEAQRG